MFVLFEIVPESIGLLLLGIGLIVTAVMLRSAISRPDQNAENGPDRAER